MLNEVYWPEKFCTYIVNINQIFVNRVVKVAFYYYYMSVKTAKIFKHSNRAYIFFPDEKGLFNFIF